ncbi:MAG: sodium:calcium antiporter, partial [Proteobacteria bacterium]|nr:sodium:calcium antiporter [Pseudomonadota bacterium]
MSLQTVLLLLGGFVALLAGAEGLVRGASRLAARFGISPLVIGLTVVAMGTSAPEIAVSVGASLQGQGDIALGNVIGSNIFNVLFIIGLSALITPLVVQQQLVRVDVPLMIVISILAWMLSLDGMLGRVDGSLLFGGVVAYTVFLITQSRRESRVEVHAEYAIEFDEAAAAAAEDKSANNLPLQLLLIVAGLGLLVLGANWLVDAAVIIALAFGVSELVIGLTVI